jgi:hypothetical protein
MFERLQNMFAFEGVWRWRVTIFINDILHTVQLPKFSNHNVPEISSLSWIERLWEKSPSSVHSSKCNVMLSGGSWQMFRRNILSPSSGPKSRPTLRPTACWFLAWPHPKMNVVHSPQLTVDLCLTTRCYAAGDSTPHCSASFFRWLEKLRNPAPSLKPWMSIQIMSQIEFNTVFVKAAIDLHSRGLSQVNKFTINFSSVNFGSSNNAYFSLKFSKQYSQCVLSSDCYIYISMLQILLFFMLGKLILELVRKFVQASPFAYLSFLSIVI